jgi:hypothetical protein
MSETFTQTKSALGRLKKSFYEASDDTKLAFMVWFAGYTVMYVAVVAYFGVLGAVFILGLWMVWAADEALK